jgi:hypothetical protein
MKKRLFDKILGKMAFVASLRGGIDGYFGFLPFYAVLGNYIERSIDERMPCIY